MLKNVRNYNLEFISNVDLFKHVCNTIEKYSSMITLEDFKHNLIDPIKLTFDSFVYNITYKDLIEGEVFRQMDKSNTNLIGYFNQNIFKYISKDWEVPEHGYDIQNTKEHIYVEMKNKYNTMNSSSGAKTYMKMMNTLLQNTESKCLLVEVIAKHSQNIPWVITLDKVKQPINERIRRVSIDKFYEIVTKNKNAFKELCQVLPTVIKDAVLYLGSKKQVNTVFSELQKLSPDILTSIYLISFKRYEGFENFKHEIIE